MIKYFKNKHIAIRQAREEGKDYGMSIMRKQKDRELKKLQAKAKKIIVQKMADIEKRDKRIAEIEKHLENFVHVFGAAKHLAMRIEDDQELKYARIKEEYQEVQGFAGRLLHTCRTFERRVPKVIEKIEKYKIEF